MCFAMVICLFMLFVTALLFAIILGAGGLGWSIAFFVVFAPIVIFGIYKWLIPQPYKQASKAMLTVMLVLSVLSVIGITKSFNKMEAEDTTNVNIQNASGDELYKMGNYYHDKIKTLDDENLKMAYVCYELAATKGNTDAMVLIGMKEIESGKTYAGLSLLEKAAQLNNEEAALELGYIYTNGDFKVPVDFQKAEKYLSFSASKGNEAAIKKLQELHSYMGK